jgi:hypothetical protein
MPGIFDFIGRGGFNAEPGITGNPNPIDANRNALLGYLAGALQGGNLGQSISTGLQGFLTGSQLDQTEAGKRAALNYVAQAGDLDPAMRAAVISNPDLAMKFLAQRIAPQTSDDIKEFEYAKRQGFEGTLADWIQRKRAGAGEYGLQGIPAVDASGNPTMVQLGKSGAAISSKLPEGVTLSKEPIKLDAGTEWILLDPITRQPVGRINKNVQEAAKAKETGKEQGAATIALPTVISNGERMLQQIEEVQNHPQKSKAVGAFVGLAPAIPGVTQDFVERADQLKGQAFLQAYQSLKGGGAITEIEGAKGEKAIARLSRAKSVTEFDAALNDLKEVVRTGVQNARAKAGVQQPAASGSMVGSPGEKIIGASPPQNVQTFSSPADVQAAIRAGKLKKGDYFSDPNGTLRMVP